MSTQVQINDVPPKTQITATAGQTVFTTNWTANAASDVVVYARTSSQEPDDLTQLVSNTNYTVAFVGGSEIVEVTFLVGRAAGDVVTITRDTPADRLNLYTNTNFTPSMLNQDVGILTLVDQQAQLYNTQVAPHYNVSATPDLGDPITGEGGDIYLPTLGANQFWIKNSGNTEIIALDLPGGGAIPSTLPLVTYTDTPYLTAEANLGALSTGVLYQTVAAGVATLSSKSTTGTGDVVLDNSPTITTPSIDQINDTNGNASLSISAIASAVNYLGIGNSATAQPPYLFATGPDTNISMSLYTKGTGAFQLFSQAATQPLVVYNGTSNQHATVFEFANTLANRYVTFPDLTGTVALSGASQNVSFGTVQTSQINDTTLNLPVATFLNVPNSVNYFSFVGQSAGLPPEIQIAGSDTNIGMNIRCKGTGGVTLISEATTSPFGIYSGTAQQHVTTFNFSNTAATRAVTFQDADGTVAYLSDITAGGYLKAFVNFNGTTSPGTIRASLNVSSVTVTGTGQYTINFTSSLANTDYATTIGYNASANASYQVAPTVYLQGKAVGSIGLYCAAGNNGVYTFTVVNHSDLNVAIFNT